jgi:hypothetical protein
MSVDQDQPDLANGLWFSESSLFFLVKDDEFPVGNGNTPLLALAKVVKKIIPYIPAVQEWIAENPAENEGEDPVLWWKKLAVMMINNGWNLAWHGTIHTNLSSEDLSSAIQKLPQAVFEPGQLDWPEDAIITINKIGRVELQPNLGKIAVIEKPVEYALDWGALTGKQATVEPTAELPAPEREVSEISARLKNLKSLLEDNLISEKDYELKKVEILSRL